MSVNSRKNPLRYANCEMKSTDIPLGRSKEKKRETKEEEEKEKEEDILTHLHTLVTIHLHDYFSYGEV